MTMQQLESPPQSVEELVSQAKQGNANAFDRLVDMFQGRLYSYAARMVHDPVEAEDIAQEAFVKAYRNLSSFRGDSSFQTWLYRIASNLTIDALRRQRRANLVSLDEPQDTHDGQAHREQEDVTAAGPDSSVETAELRREVHRAIQQLSPKLRSVVVLFDLQGLSYEEIAEILRLPMGTVKSRLFNARTELKRKLKGVLPEYDGG